MVIIKYLINKYIYFFIINFKCQQNRNKTSLNENFFLIYTIEKKQSDTLDVDTCTLSNKNLSKTKALNVTIF